jgi:phosphoglycerol transferase
LTKINQISALNLAAVLLGTIGGIGAIISYAGFPQIRGYNRISVFIAFFSILAVILLMDYIIHKYSHNAYKMSYRSLHYCCYLFWHIRQTSPHLFRYTNIKEEFLSDENFVSSIEENFPEDTMVFQLPYVAFPESPPVNRMTDYDLFRGYLHSENIHWSYGAMKGRDGDEWQRYVTDKPVDEMLRELSIEGLMAYMWIVMATQIVGKR